MSKSYTETTGIIQGVIAYMQDDANKAALAAKDFDVTKPLARLTTAAQNIGQLNTEQEQLKVQLGKKTAELNTALDSGYTDASGMIDAMMGVLGKNSPEAKNLQKIRTGYGPGAKPTPPPAK